MLLKTAVDFSTLNIANLKATCLEDKMLYANKVDKLEMAHLFEEAFDNLLTQLEENAANEMLFLINKSCIEIISAPNTWKIIDTKERETTYAQHEAIQLINASPTAIAALYTICVYWLN